MKIIKEFDAYSSQVELVEIAGKNYVLKTVDREEANNEKRFQHILRQHGLPSLQIFDIVPLQENQLLLEYVPGSEKIDYTDPAQVRRWGAATRQMHNIHFDRPFSVTEENKELYFDWNVYLRKHIEQSVTARMNGKTDLSNQELQKIAEYVMPRLTFKKQHYSLLHADLHDGNTLKRDDYIIIYDKSSELFAGHYLYDLAIVATLYPNGVYIHTNETKYQNDSVLLSAFMEGYGEDFIHEHKPQLDIYMLIRNLDRYPNPFVKIEKQIFQTILAA